MMFLSGSFWPLEIMPGYMQTIAEFMLLTYLSEGLRYTMVYGDPSLATIDYIIVSLLALFLILVASLLTKWKSE